MRDGAIVRALFAISSFFRRVHAALRRTDGLVTCIIAGALKKATDEFRQIATLRARARNAIGVGLACASAGIIIVPSPDRFGSQAGNGLVELAGGNLL